MSRTSLVCTLLAAGCLLQGPDAHAAGTLAGTVIGNVAIVDYVIQGAHLTQNSNISRFRVDDKVVFAVTADNAAAVTITPSGRAYLTYTLFNDGNAPHDFTLSTATTGPAALSPALGPTFFADAAGTTPLPLDPNVSNLPYIANIAPDTSRTIYLYITAPPDLTDGQTITYTVTAEAFQSGNLGAQNPPVKSSTRAAADAAFNKNLNPLNSYVVLADGHGNGGDSDRDGRYAVNATDGTSPIGFIGRSATVSIVKSVIVSDLFGGSQPLTGATLHYTLLVSTAGNGTALGVIITDKVPVNTTYQTGSLKLDDAPLSDPADTDAGDVNATTPGFVTVKLGDLTRAQTHKIEFDTKIN